MRTLIGVCVLVWSLHAHADVAIDLPPEADSAPAPAADAAPAHTNESATHVGGYAEMHYNLSWTDRIADHNAQIDFHRLVLFVGHELDERLHFYSEIEVEHADEVELEQAYLDYVLCPDTLKLRAGVVLVPLGIVNRDHEPPVFFGVERPTVDQRIIPSTWSEGGVGVVGARGAWRYQAYLVGGLDAGGFSAGSALRGGRQNVSHARARGLAVTGRAEWEPTLGVVAGVAVYAGLAGPNASLYGVSPGPGTPGPAIDVNVPVVVTTVDGRVQRGALEARAVFAWGHIGDARRLSGAYRDPDSTDPVGPVASAFVGGYGEVAYNVLAGAATTHQLLPFARVEYADTMASTAPSVADDPTQAATDVVVGLSYRPHPRAVFKSDFVAHMPGGDASSEKIFSLGVGLTY